MPSKPAPFRFRWEHELRERAGETGLPLQAIGVLALMATYADIDGRRVFVSDVAMAGRVGCSRKTWLKWRTLGAKAGWITLVEERPGRSNVYDLSIPRPVAPEGQAGGVTGRGRVPDGEGVSPCRDRGVSVATHPLFPEGDTTRVSTSPPTNTSTGSSGDIVIHGAEVTLSTGEVVIVPSFDDETELEPKATAAAGRATATAGRSTEGRPAGNQADHQHAGAPPPVAAGAAPSPGLSGTVNNTHEFIAGACPCVNATEHHNAVVELPPYPTDSHGNLLSSWSALGYASNYDDRAKHDRIAWLRDAHGTPRRPTYSPEFYTSAKRAKDEARHQGFHDRAMRDDVPMEAFESNPEMQNYVEMVQSGEVRDWQEVPPPLQRWAARYIERHRGPDY
ncbi:hypothetical protein [Isoptericola sp. NPDC057391]|uniref:hypothetical protein n=1 Tax=Isoptericola sp. NPDC057391 TaxID=3346117 RepID=UPI00363B8110